MKEEYYKTKSFAFAVRIVNFINFNSKKKNMFYLNNF